MKLTRSAPKAFEKLDLALKALAGIQGKVGWFESAKYENGTPVAYTMSLNEMGDGPTPPRPFMRPTAIDKKKEWVDIAAEGARRVLAGNASPQTVMELLTTKAEGDVSKTITDLTAPALSPITIEIRAMKKRNPNLKVTGATVGEAAARVNAPGYVAPTGVSTKPLNDTGRALATLTHIVENGS